jgi:putative Holliday junction resolvase
VRHNEEFLGVDVGSTRIGIARGSSIAKIAEPLKTVPANQALSELSDLIDKNSVAGIVVGLPRNLDGNDTTQTKAVRQWVKDAMSLIKIPLYWQDEALTSNVAEAKSISPHGSDAEAAALILQDFLNANKAERMRV